MESWYWKQYIGTVAAQLRCVVEEDEDDSHYHILERDIAIACFLLRRLIESHKVTEELCSTEVSLHASPSTGKRSTLMNNHRIDKLYDLSHETTVKKKPRFICNQVVHAYSDLLLTDEEGRCLEYYVVSDWDRGKHIWRIPVGALASLLECAAHDEVNYMRMLWNAKRQDYDVEAH